MLLNATGTRRQRPVFAAERRPALSNAYEMREDEGTTGTIRLQTKADDSRPRDLQEQKLRILNQQLLAQVASLQNNLVQLEGDPDNKSPDLRTLDELIQKRIVKAKLLAHPTPSTKTMKLLSPKRTRSTSSLQKFSTPTFYYYSEVSDPMQHICHFRDKMVIYSREDSTMCRTFPLSLKGVASDWFYSLPPRSPQFH